MISAVFVYGRFKIIVVLKLYIVLSYSSLHVTHAAQLVRYSIEYSSCATYDEYGAAANVMWGQRLKDLVIPLPKNINPKILLAVLMNEHFSSAKNLHIFI